MATEQINSSGAPAAETAVLDLRASARSIDHAELRQIELQGFEARR